MNPRISSTYPAMTDKDRCGIVSPPLPMSSRGGAGAFARNLHLRIRSFGINQNDEDDEAPLLWHQNGDIVHPFQSMPLSPADDVIEYPLLNSAMSNNHNNTEDLVQPEADQCLHSSDQSIKVPNSSSIASRSDCALYVHSGLAENSTENFLESCSSVDEIYETASDNSGDDEVWESIPNLLRIDELSTEKVEHASTFSFNGAKETPEINVITEEDESREISPITYHSDESEETVPKVRRCSSLKTGKTPPGTPSCKKIVRFADALGLDLADVKTFVDEIPKIPTSAYHDLRNLEDEIEEFPIVKTIKENKSANTLIPMFEQPAVQSDFLDIVRNNYVCLENAVVEDQFSFAIRGLVRVRNIDFHKSVLLRYSTNSWQSYVDVQASYVENSCDGFSDKFSFLIYANMLKPGQTLEMAVVFQARGEQFWDNNKGSNYCFHCVSLHPQASTSSTPIGPSEWENDNWGAAFY